MIYGQVKFRSEETLTTFPLPSQVGFISPLEAVQARPSLRVLSVPVPAHMQAWQAAGPVPVPHSSLLSEPSVVDVLSMMR